MSNTRVFNYQEITNIYNQMNQIIGDSSDPSTIAGLLHKIDEDYHEVVNGPAGEDELALRGDLGMQLLNNWENTAGSFPAFVENFSSWSTLVAQTAGDYSAFEEQVRGIRSNNPLGWNTGGIQNGYVASSSYTNSFTDEQLDEAAAAIQMYDLVGAYYVDTGMVSYAKKNAFWNGFGDVLSVVSIVASGCSLVKGLGVVGGAAKGAGAAAGVADDVVDDGTRIIIDSTSGPQMITGAAGQSVDDLVAGAGKAAGQSVDDLIAGGKPIANSTLYGLTDDAASATDKLISQGYTLVDDTWQLPTKINAGNSMFAQSVDDFIINGQSVPNSTLSSLPGESIGSATDKLIKSGYTLSGDTWQAPASLVRNSAGVAAAPSIANGSAFGEIVDDVAKGSADDLIAKGYTMSADGALHAPATAFNGAPSYAGNSAIAHPIYDKMPSVLGKGTYYAGEGAAKVVDVAKSGAGKVVDVAKSGAGKVGGYIKSAGSTAGTYIKSAGSAVKTGLSTAGTYIKDVGITTVLKDTVKAAGTTGIVGATTNVGQNIVNNANIQRNAQMVANARNHFGNNGN